VDRKDVVEDVLQRFMSRLAVLQEFVLRQFREGIALVVEDPLVVLVDVAEVSDARHAFREPGPPDKGFDGQREVIDAISKSYGFSYPIRILI